MRAAQACGLNLTMHPAEIRSTHFVQVPASSPLGIQTFEKQIRTFE
jgi:hypothetical protein